VRSLAGRVALLVTVAAALVLAAVAVVAIAEVSRRERAALDRELRTTGDRLVTPARRAIAAPRLADRPQSPLATVPGTLSVRLTRRGEVVFDDLRAPGVPLPDANGVTTATDEAGAHWRVLVRTVRPRVQGRLVVSAPLAPLEQRLRDLRRVIALTALAGLIALALAARTLTARALRPLQRLRDRAAGVSSTRDLTTRVDTAGPEEVDALADSLNAMLARLETSSAATEQALEAARRFTADAGHELRTPLTAIRANIAALRHGAGSAGALGGAERARVLAELDRDLVRLTALLDGLQALARGDAGAVERTPVDVGDVADAALADARRRHPDVDFAFGDARELTVEGDETGLRAALDNLLENAARHGARRVRVSVTESGVRVDDDGPGIAPADRERVFERFSRGAHAAVPGSGLGLAVVAQQARLHGGRAYATDSPLGGAGLVLELTGANEHTTVPSPDRKAR
jgi:two-component system, OmpR family, sensor histidine kinase PrrB